jgi:deoxyribose-phosphate aldolase
MIVKSNSGLQIGTVIDFPEGKSSIQDKLSVKLVLKMVLMN